MNKILIHSNDKLSSNNLKNELLNILHKFQIESVQTNPDIVLVLGGDGTMLSAIRKYHNLKVPFVGINTGHLGFMSNTFTNDFEKLIEILQNKQYRKEYLSMLKIKATTTTNKEYTTNAFNEVVVKHTLPSMMSSKININDCFFNNFTGDGIIVSTPMGSTGYAIWAGGAAIHGGVKAFQITPISPNSNAINNPFKHSIIMPENTRLHIEIVKAHKRKVTVSVDGRELTSEYISDIEISMFEDKIELIYFNTHDYFSLYKDKIIGDKICNRNGGENDL